MAFQQSPIIKFEELQDESFLSGTSDSFTSLFAASTPSPTANTIHPIEMMTPQSFTDEKQEPSRLSAIPETSEEPSAESADASPDKKPTKKRKSWGQVLPEPKTNLPPRKRAKTEDEKEQRRVERVLRNRRAAQSSRERKRLEVEALEKRNKELEQLLINVQKTNLMLLEELNRVQRPSGVVTRSSSPLDSLRESITLSQQLFSSPDGQKMDDIMRSGVGPSANPQTVNPASLSPPLNPVPDCDETQELEEERGRADEDEIMTDETPRAEVHAKTPEPRASEATPTIPSDSTQRPAEMLCDLQCQSPGMSRAPSGSQTSMLPLFSFYMQLSMIFSLVPMILSACQRPLTQIAISSKAGFSLLPTPQLLATIIWLVTIPPASRIIPTSTSSTSTTSSPTTPTTRPVTLWQRATSPLRTAEATSNSPTLRLKSLRNILTSSPSLARPLMDATLVALRLVSEGRDDRAGDAECHASSEMRGDVDELTKCLSSIVLPSREALMALLWALKLEERRIRLRNHSAAPGAERSTISDNQLDNLKAAQMAASGLKAI